MKKIRSTYSGVLEVVMEEGQKVLNSKNTSYSYGNLQEVWNQALRKIPLGGISHVLILGMGGGSSIRLLRDAYRYEGKITAVEIDPIIIELARTEFNIVSDKYLKIICDDAAEYSKKCRTRFDLVLIDVFIDRHVPVQILEERFWTRLSKIIQPGGQFLFNAFEDTDTLQKIEETLHQNGMDTLRFTKVNGANLMLYGKSRKK